MNNHMENDYYEEKYIQKHDAYTIDRPDARYERRYRSR